MITRVPVHLCATALGVVLVGSASGAAAQTPLTLDDAMAKAAAAAPRLVEARARVSAAEALVTSRQAQTRPILTATSGYLRTNHVDEFGIQQPGGSLRVLFPDIPSNYRARAELGVPLYTSGRLQLAVDSARADQAAAQADARTVRADLELEVATAYWTLATAGARVRVFERGQERADRVVADVGARVDAGLLPPNERLSAQALRARQRVALIQAQNDRAFAEAALGRLVGASPDERFELTTPVTMPMAGAEELTAGHVPTLARQAADGRPERQSLTFRARSLRDAAHALAGLTRPQVSAVAAVEPARPNPRFVPRTDTWHTSWDLGVSLSWSLWDSGRNKADRAALVAQADAITARVAEFDAVVALDIRQRQLECQSTRAALDAVREAVEAATEARRVVGERFAAGVAVSTDVLDADTALLEAELEGTRLEAALRISEARLLRAVGGR